MEVVLRGGSGAVSSVVGVQRVEEEETVMVRFAGFGRGGGGTGWLKRGGEAVETEKIGLGIPTAPGVNAGAEGRDGHGSRDGGTTLGDWKQLRAVRVGHTVDQSGSPRFGERYGCPTEGGPDLLLSLRPALVPFLTLPDARSLSYVRPSPGDPLNRPFTLLKRPPSNSRPYFERLRLPLLKRSKGSNDPRVAGVDLSVRDTRLSLLHDAVRREIVDRSGGDAGDRHLSHISISLSLFAEDSRTTGLLSRLRAR